MTVIRPMAGKRAFYLDEVDRALVDLIKADLTFVGQLRILGLVRLGHLRLDRGFAVGLADQDLDSVLTTAAGSRSPPALSFVSCWTPGLLPLCWLVAVASSFR